MNFLNIYDILVYYFKKDIAKVVFNFTYNIEKNEQGVILDKIFTENNEKIYKFKYINSRYYSFYIRKINSQLIYSNFNEYSIYNNEQIFTNLVQYRHDDSDTFIYINADKYKQYIEDIIERENKNEIN